MSAVSCLAVAGRVVGAAAAVRSYSCRLTTTTLMTRLESSLCSLVKKRPAVPCSFALNSPKALRGRLLQWRADDSSNKALL